MGIREWCEAMVEHVVKHGWLAKEVAQDIEARSGLARVRARLERPS